MTALFARGLAFALFLTLIAAPAALAQQTPPPQPQTEAVADFTDAELDAFAEAYVAIEDVQARYEAEFGDVQDPQQAQQAQQRFQTEVIGVLEESGIDAARYEQVVVATQTDSALTEDLVARIETVRQEQAGG